MNEEWKTGNEREIFALGNMDKKGMESWGVVGKCGVNGVNENGEFPVDKCAERDLFLSSVFFHHRVWVWVV